MAKCNQLTLLPFKGLTATMLISDMFGLKAYGNKCVCWQCV